MKFFLLILTLFLFSKCSDNSEDKTKLENEKTKNDLQIKEQKVQLISIYPTKDGMTLVAISETSSDLPKEKLSRGTALLYGYEDDKENIKIPFEYTYASNFYQSKALVSKGREPYKNFFFIDSNGKKIKPLLEQQNQIDIINKYNVNESLYVINLDGLDLKKNPDINSETIAHIDFQSEVTVLNISEKKSCFSQDKINGCWVNIKYGEIKGYLFDGYLSYYKIDKLNKKKNLYKFFISIGSVESENVFNCLYCHPIDIKILKNNIVTFNYQHEGTDDQWIIKIPKVNFQQGFLISKLLFYDLLDNEVLPSNFIFTKKSENDKIYKGMTFYEEIKLFIDDDNYFTIIYNNGV